MNFFAVVSLCIGLFFSPLQAASEKPKAGGTLTMAISRDLVVMHPFIRTASTEARIRHLMFEPLLGLDRKGDVQPHVAESWELSKDGRTYTFKIRRGMKFHHGQEVTAADIKFAIDYSLNPKNGATGLNNLTLVEQVEAPDRYTLRIQLKKASPAFLSFLADIATFSVVPKGSLQEGATKPSTYPPGTGPFKFVEWQPNQRIVLERFDEYWGHKAYVDRVILRPIADDTVRVTAVQTGDVDLIERTPYEWVKEIIGGKVKGVSYTKAAYAGYVRLIFNVTAPPFNNKKLRQAVAHAVNKKEILDASFFGFGEVVDQQYPKGHTWYVEGVPSAEFNPEKARQLLREAGYTGEAVGQVTPQEDIRLHQATALQAQLKRVGFNMKVDLLEWGAYRNAQRRGDFKFMFYGGSYDPDPSVTYKLDFLCEPDLSKRSNNVAGYCNREIEGLFEKAETELDGQKRRALFRQILAKVNDDLPILPVAHVPRFFAFRDHVKGFTSNDGGDFLYWGGGLHYTWLEK